MFSAATKTGSQPSQAANYIEDVFSTYLYTGNNSTQTINNGIDLAGKGGLVWLKYRSGSTGSTYHHVYDSARGKSGNPSYNYLYTNSTFAEGTGSYGPTSFNSNGFTLNSYLNESTIPYVSWTFAKQPKFFDVVTYTGNGTSQNISHSLGSTPGFIIVKNCSNSFNWATYHRSLGAGYTTPLNTTSAAISSSSVWNNTAPTSTQFTVGSASTTNESGSTFVAYLFAHNAGGFGTSGTDNVISCGSFTANGSGIADVTLGYEPQYVMIKSSTTSDQWQIFDVMRGWSQTSGAWLNANSSAAESTWSGTVFYPTATGFHYEFGTAGQTYIYMAIRRPMKVPTDATTVFSNNLETTSANPQTLTTGFPVDLVMNSSRSGGGTYFIDRLRGASIANLVYLQSNNTNAEGSSTPGGLGLDNNTAIVDNGWYNTSGAIYWNFSRRPKFFDEVCYTGTGSATNITHNLGVAPELLIVKSRTNGTSWGVLANTPTFNGQVGLLDDSGNFGTGFYPTYFNSTLPTSTNFRVGTSAATNGSGATYVAYLFSTCAGVSKVGVYSGTGASQTINCGFTGGARFVLIKRTDAYANWYVWDTARGMVSGTDPSLSLNTTAAEVNANSVYTATTGFSLLASPSADVNTSGGNYIYLAIA